MDLPSYEEFIGKHKGDTAFVCGAGLSFYNIINHPGFERIHDHVVVSVNSSFVAMRDWDKGDPDKRYWISNDALCRWWDYWIDVKAAKANKIVRDSWKKHFKEIPDFYQFHCRPTPEDTINSEDTGLCYCSSVPSAVDLCIQMGCKNIYILGLDHDFDIEGRSHFWQMLNPKDQPQRIDKKLATHQEQKNAFKYNDLAFSALRQFAIERGVSVVNCNIESKVEAFLKKPFEHIIGELR